MIQRSRQSCPPPSFRARRAVIHQVCFENLESFAIHFHYQEAVVVALADYVHHLARRYRNGDTVVVPVRQGYGRKMGLVAHIVQFLLHGSRLLSRKLKLGG